MSPPLVLLLFLLAIAFCFLPANVLVSTLLILVSLSTLFVFSLFSSSSSPWSVVVTFLQKAVAASMRKDTSKKWTNLGLWISQDDNEDYCEACERLCCSLASAANLSEGDRVLASGCGRGDELYIYKDFGADIVTGVDPDPDGTRKFEPKADIELLCMTASDAVETLKEEQYNKVVALDNIYHYPSKTQFFKEARSLLSGVDSGKIAVTDILAR